MTFQMIPQYVQITVIHAPVNNDQKNGFIKYNF